ncbi:hypothetical protein [Chamaesiphon polymorphus]|nr:hypothetical protein [Chamaesiphon polymorphus]
MTEKTVESEQIYRWLISARRSPSDRHLQFHTRSGLAVYRESHPQQHPQS